MRLAILVTAGCLLIADMARAQDFEQARETARTLVENRQVPFGGIETLSYLPPRWTLNTFYRYWTGQTPNRSPYFVIRREFGSPDQAPRVVWADSRQCSAVDEVLAEMEAVPVGRFNALTIPTPPVLDGALHTLWGSWGVVGADNIAVKLEVSGNVYSPAAAWWSRSLQRLEDCWSAEQPTID